MKLKLIILSVFLASSFSSVFAQATSTSSTSSEPTVKVNLFTGKWFDRTEYALGVKNTDVKKIEND